MAPIIIPGWRDSGPGHWQSLWAEQLPGAVRVQQDDWADPYCPVRTAGAYARAWGSEFVRLQNAGHVNIESGFGAWPLGLALLQSLVGEGWVQPSPHATPLKDSVLETT